MSTPSDQPRRRRTRFSLRTFLIAFTLLAIWLGWNVYQVQQRERMEQYILTIGATTWLKNNPRPVITYGEPLKPWKSLPLRWRIVGAKSVRSINLTHIDVGEDDQKHIKEWFPEADVFF